MKCEDLMDKKQTQGISILYSCCTFCNKSKTQLRQNNCEISDFVKIATWNNESEYFRKKLHQFFSFSKIKNSAFFSNHDIGGKGFFKKIESKYATSTDFKRNREFLISYVVEKSSHSTSILVQILYRIFWESKNSISVTLIFFRYFIQRLSGPWRIFFQKRLFKLQPTSPKGLFEGKNYLLTW